MSKIIKIEVDYNFLCNNFLYSSDLLIEGLYKYRNALSSKNCDDIINYFLNNKDIRDHDYDCERDDKAYCQKYCQLEPDYTNYNKVILEKLLINFKNIKNEDKVKYINTLFLFYKIDTSIDKESTILFYFNKLIGWETDKDFDYLYNGCSKEYFLNKILHFLKMPGKFVINDLYFFNLGEQNDNTTN